MPQILSLTGDRRSRMEERIQVSCRTCRGTSGMTPESSLPFWGGIGRYAKSRLTTVRMGVYTQSIHRWNRIPLLRTHRVYLSNRALASSEARAWASEREEAHATRRTFGWGE